MVVCDVAQEEAIGLHGIGREEQTTGGDGGEMIRTLKNGWSGVSPFGMTIAGDEAGNVVLNEELVEVCEQMTETLLCQAVTTGEKVDEWIEDEETGVDLFDGL